MHTHAHAQDCRCEAGRGCLVNCMDSYLSGKIKSERLGGVKAGCSNGGARLSIQADQSRL